MTSSASPSSPSPSRRSDIAASPRAVARSSSTSEVRPALRDRAWVRPSPSPPCSSSSPVAPGPTSTRRSSTAASGTPAAGGSPSPSRCPSCSSVWARSSAAGPGWSTSAKRGNSSSAPASGPTSGPASVGPGPLALVVTLLAAIIGGAIWAGIAGALRYWRNVPEVLTTLLLTAVAANLMGCGLRNRFLLLGPGRRAEPTATRSASRSRPTPASRGSRCSATSFP